MFFRLLLESFVRQRRRKALAGIAILLGTTAITAMLALATTIGDRIHKELAVYGANIVITPKADQLAINIGGVDIKPATGGAYLHESDLEKLKTIFWANNITGVSPELHMAGKILIRRDGTGRPFDPRAIWRRNDWPNWPTSNYENFSVTAVGYWFEHPFDEARIGAPQLHPWWKLQGRWPVEHAIQAIHGEGAQEIVLGAGLAQRLGMGIGDWINMGTEFEGDVVGIVTTGDATEQQILYPLDADEQVLPIGPDGRPVGEIQRDIDRVEVSARTKPEDAFARVDPATLSPKQYEIWHCRPYANSIADDIQQAIPGADAQQLRRVEQTEGTVLSRISGLMWLIAAAALLAAGFAVSAAMATAVLERRNEIGLMRSLGASRAAIAALFYAETGLLALLFGTLGYLLGSGLAAWLGARIFSDGPGDPTGHVFNPTLLPITVGIALLVALAGSTPSIRSALNLDPAAVLRADA